MDIHIISGFLGAGKTTFLNKYLPVLSGKTVVIENEFGDVGIDGGLIQGGIPVHEIFAGCICCSLAYDFRKGIKEVCERFRPDQIVIEPSGVGRLSDIIKACEKVKEKEGIDLTITKLISVVDIASFEEYEEGFGAFYLDQIQHARLLLVSNGDKVEPEKRRELIVRLSGINPKALIYEGDIRQLEGETVKELLSMTADYEKDCEAVQAFALPADKIFSSIALQALGRFTKEELDCIFTELGKEEFGNVLRAKGMVRSPQGSLLHVEYTRSGGCCTEADAPEEDGTDVNIVIIGCNLNETVLKKLFKNN